MDTLVKDIRYAARNLIRRAGVHRGCRNHSGPGIGVNTTIFSLANSFFCDRCRLLRRKISSGFTDRENPLRIRTTSSTTITMIFSTECLPTTGSD